MQTLLSETPYWPMQRRSTENDAKTPAQGTSSENHDAKESSASVQLYSSLAYSQGHVLLKTAIVPVISCQTSLGANILLDEGAQR